MIHEQLEELRQYCLEEGLHIETSALSGGGTLIRVPSVMIGPGWNRDRADVLFVAPPGYPAAKPDCFWVTPGNFRLMDGGTPQASNDGNPIPGDTEPGRSATWFSWHVQTWNPNKDTLKKYYKVIRSRLTPAR
ncbi:MAG: E2/UBC family protein [Hylemonella sp.]|jgi:hypothetical protein